LIFGSVASSIVQADVAPVLFVRRQPEAPSDHSAV
jgi:hypothetical protein